MMDSRRWQLIVFALVAAVCVSGCATGGGESPSAEPDEERAEEPRWMTPETPAEQLAVRVHRAHGGEHWNDVETLSFRFVVEADGEEMFGADHHWEVAESTDRVQWTDDEGEWDVTVDLDTREVVEGSVDDGELGDRRETAAEKAYTRWINDAYWLLMPLKLFDPGVQLSLEEAADGGGVLELSFDDVGLTPGDRYMVRADSESGEVRSWTMDLEGSEETTEVEWGGYREFGPLYLPVERTWEGGARRIVFEDVDVGTADE